jgi:hypothetical protein
MFTKNDLRGYLKARDDARKNVLGGITYNDDYNRATFGIDSATHTAICKALTAKFGMFVPEKITLAMIKGSDQ